MLHTYDSFIHSQQLSTRRRNLVERINYDIREAGKEAQGGREAGRQGGKKVSNFPIFSYCVESLQKLLKNRSRTNIKKFNVIIYI